MNALRPALRGIALAGGVAAALALAGGAPAARSALPSACTLLTKAHPEKVLGHGKTLAVAHRKAQKFGTGKYASYECSETVGTQPIWLTVSSSNGGSGGVKITSETHPTGLGSGATLVVGTAAGSNKPVDFVDFHRGGVYLDLTANGASPALLTTIARAVYKLV